MTREEFEKLIEAEFEKAIPEKFRPHIKNVAFLVEDEPSAQVRAQEGLHAGETLLGLYHGIPHTERGDNYGIGMTLPDTITLFQKPIENTGGDRKKIKHIIKETIWHEVGHHFGLSDDEIERLERKR